MSGVKVPVDGDIGPLLAQFRKLPGLTQEEMDAVGRVIDTEINRGKIAKAFHDLPGVAAKDAKKAANMVAREMDRAAKESERSIKDIDKAFKVLGTSVLDDLGDLNEGISALGTAGGVAAIGVTAVAEAAGVLMAGGALVDFLYDAAASTHELDDEQRALDEALRAVQQTIGRDVAPAFEQLLTVAVAGALATNDAAKALFEFRDDVVEWYKGAPALVRGAANAMSNNWLEMQSHAEEGNRALEDGTSVLGDYFGKARDLIGGLDAAADAQGRAAGKTDEHTAAKHRQIDATREQTTALQREIAALQARDPYMEKMIELDNREADALAQLDVGLKSNSASLDDMLAKKQLDQEATLQGALDMAGAVETVTQLIAEQEGVSRGAAMAMVILQKAAAETQIIVNTAVAVTRALAELGPVAGPIAAAGIIATGAAQAAVVAATPESFHTGGLRYAPDEMAATVRPGEGVLTAQGVAGAGGAQGVAALNRGDSQQQQIVVVQQYGHRVFDAVVADSVRMSGPLRAAIKGGRRIGHARRRL